MRHLLYALAAIAILWNSPGAQAQESVEHEIVIKQSGVEVVSACQDFWHTPQLARWCQKKAYCDFLQKNRPASACSAKNLAAIMRQINTAPPGTKFTIPAPVPHAAVVQPEPSAKAANAVDALNERISGLQAVIASERTKNESLVRAHSATDARVSDLAARLRTATEERDALQKQIDELKLVPPIIPGDVEAAGKVAGLQAQLTALGGLNEGMQAERRALQKKLEIAERERNAKTDLANSYFAKLSQEEARNTALGVKIAALEVADKTQKTRIKELEKELAGGTGLLQYIDPDVRPVAVFVAFIVLPLLLVALGIWFFFRGHTIRRLRVQPQQLNAALIGRIKEADGLRADLVEREDELSTAQRIGRAKEAEIARLNTQFATLATRIDTANGEVVALEREKAQVQAELSLASRRVRELEEKVAELQEAQPPSLPVGETFVWTNPDAVPPESTDKFDGLGVPFEKAPNAPAWGCLTVPGTAGAPTITAT